MGPVVAILLISTGQAVVQIQCWVVALLVRLMVQVAVMGQPLVMEVDMVEATQQ